MPNEKVIKISPSSLNLFLDCPRCFWLQINEGLRRPEPPASTLPNGIDLTLKVYFDHWRKKDGIPPLLKDKIPGRLFGAEAAIAQFRSRSFHWFDKEVGAYLTGILDDALELSDGSVVPLDNKTRGFPPLEPHVAHIRQMSAYSVLLKENGFKTKNLAYLIYWFFNHKKMNLENPLEFNIAVEEVKTDPDALQSAFRAAATVLKGPLPPSGSSCKFCHYVHATKNY